MLSIETINNQLRKRVLNCCPDEVDSAPQVVKDIYVSAVDFFGEERVDLQKMEDPTMWKYVLGSRNMADLLELFGISEELFPYTSSDFHAILQEEKTFTKFLNLITPDRLQNGSLPVYCIIVHFHDIIVSNEHEASTQIEDIYSCTCITYRGYHSLFNFWYRTTVSKLHYMSSYRHSHLRSGREPGWLKPCLGSGPITMTMNTLRNDSDINFWNLFWLELDKCIRVESIAGGPYIHIRDISDRGSVRDDFTCFRYGNSRWLKALGNDMLKVIVFDILKSGKLEYAFRCNTISIINPFEDFTIIASNCVLGYLQRLHEQDSEKAKRLAFKLFDFNEMSAGQITTAGHILSYNDVSPVSVPRDRPAGFSFRGTPVMFKVVENTNDQRVFYYVLHPNVTGTLKNILTILINNIYAKKYSNS